jgi:hypothetical protein
MCLKIRKKYSWKVGVLTLKHFTISKLIPAFDLCHHISAVFSPFYTVFFYYKNSNRTVTNKLPTYCVSVVRLPNRNLIVFCWRLSQSSMTSMQKYLTCRYLLEAYCSCILTSPRFHLVLRNYKRCIIYNIIFFFCFILRFFIEIFTTRRKYFWVSFIIRDVCGKLLCLY